VDQKRDMSKHQKETWEEIRLLGRWRFIFAGLLQRGFRCTIPLGMVFVVSSLLTYRMAEVLAQFTTFGMAFIILTVVIGSGDGFDRWYKNEQKYKKFIENERAHQFSADINH
jgi:hypothetical protein